MALKQSLAASTIRRACHAAIVHLLTVALLAQELARRCRRLAHQGASNIDSADLFAARVTFDGAHLCGRRLSNRSVSEQETTIHRRVHTMMVCNDAQSPSGWTDDYGTNVHRRKSHERQTLTVQICLLPV